MAFVLCAGCPICSRGAHNVTLTGGNPIRQTVDTRAKTITNVTRPGHRYHQGRVAISIRTRNGVVGALVTGTGIGSRRTENSILGPIIFQLLGIRAGAAANPGYVPVVP